MEPTEKARPDMRAADMITLLNFATTDPVALSVSIAFTFGQVAGDHHKAWVIDQMVRKLTGDQYQMFVDAYENGGEYEWGTGVAP